MGAHYHAVLSRLEARGWQALQQPVRLPAWQKLWVVGRHYL